MTSAGLHCRLDWGPCVCVWWCARARGVCAWCVCVCVCVCGGGGGAAAHLVMPDKVTDGFKLRPELSQNKHVPDPPNEQIHHATVAPVAR